MSKLTVRLSSTAFGKAGCILHLKRSVIDGYRPTHMAARLVYGIAVHKFIDQMYKTSGNVLLSIQAAKKAFALPKIDDKKSPHLSEERHLVNTCLNLWSGFIQEDGAFELIQLNGIPATEQTFSIPFYEDEFISVLLEGTIDKLGQFIKGCFAIGDWKTTSSWDNNGYFEQFELSRQLRLYTLACKIMAEREPQSTLGKIGATKMGAFIDAIFLKPNANENVVRRSEVFQFSNEDLSAYSTTLTDYCIKLSEAVKTSHYPKEGIMNGSCEGKWGKCDFWNVCKSPENIAALLLKRDFQIVPWTPCDYNNLDL